MNDQYADAIEHEPTPRPARGFTGPTAAASFYDDALPADDDIVYGRRDTATSVQATRLRRGYGWDL